MAYEIPKLIKCKLFIESRLAGGARIDSTLESGQGHRLVAIVVLVVVVA